MMLKTKQRGEFKHITNVNQSGVIDVTDILLE